MIGSASSGSILQRSLLLMGGMLGASALFVGMMMLVLGLLVDRATGASADSATREKPSVAATASPGAKNKATLTQGGGNAGGST